MYKRKYIPILCFVFVIVLNMYVIQKNAVRPTTSERITLTEPVFRNFYKSPITPAPKSEKKEPQPLTFIRPLNGGVVTSDFGPRSRNNHQGIDIAADTGTPIFASMSGVIKTADWIEGYGYAVIIQHENNTETLYAHCSVLHTEQNQTVQQGDTIAEVGSTGNSTGPHLHFEIIKDGVHMDPAQYIAF